MNSTGLLVALPVLVLGSACFIAFGALISQCFEKPDVAGNFYLFALLPMFFLGGGFPADMLPEVVNMISPWLPTTMVNDMLRTLFADGTAPDTLIRSITGLTVYTIGMALVTASRFHWEA